MLENNGKIEYEQNEVIKTKTHLNQKQTLLPVSGDSLKLLADSSTDIPIIALSNLTKTYRMSNTNVHALRGISLEIQHNEFVAIMGPSGSGKSTLMNLVGCLDRPTHGEYRLIGISTGQMKPEALALMRNKYIGFVFQGFHLLPQVSALENVALPLLYAGFPRGWRERRALKALQLLGLGHRANHRPSQLSGGQQQRVAIARALVNNPPLLLADEPTGNLDSHTSAEIMTILQELHAHGLTIVVVTHNPAVMEYAQRQIVLGDGRVVHDEQTQPFHSL